MSTLCIGQFGQLAKALALCDSALVFWSSAVCDLGVVGEHELTAKLVRSGATCVINTGAYTAVDKAQVEISTALAVNTEGVAKLGRVCAQLEIPLIHISTDYVFNGEKSTIYRPSDQVCPINVYGMSKALGEQTLLNQPQLLCRIVRTSWLYSIFGHNFFLTMVSRMRQGQVLKVVDDQVGTPTSAHLLARCLFDLSTQAQSWSDVSVLHFAHYGAASWYDFAVEIAQQAVSRDLLQTMPVITPVPSTEFPTPAPRPSQSRLGLSQALEPFGCHWHSGLQQTFDAYVEQIESKSYE